jgi:hypothetical protein
VLAVLIASEVVSGGIILYTALPVV